MIEELLAAAIHSERLAAAEAARREIEILRSVHRSKDARPHREAAQPRDGRLAPDSP